MSLRSVKFEIVSPEKKVFEAEVIRVTAPTTTGEITILPGHIPLVSNLAPGVIEIETAVGGVEIISISGGFLQVLKDKIVILADTAERASEINVERSEEAKKRAEDLKFAEKSLDQKQFAEMSAKIEKELARTRAVKRWKRLKNIKEPK